MSPLHSLTSWRLAQSCVELAPSTFQLLRLVPASLVKDQGSEAQVLGQGRERLLLRPSTIFRCPLTLLGPPIYLAVYAILFAPMLRTRKPPPPIWKTLASRRKPNSLSIISNCADKTL